MNQLVKIGRKHPYELPEIISCNFLMEGRKAVDKSASTNRAPEGNKFKQKGILTHMHDSFF
jgi:hypothetical protein